MENKRIGLGSTSQLVPQFGLIGVFLLILGAHGLNYLIGSFHLFSLFWVWAFRIGSLLLLIAIQYSWKFLSRNPSKYQQYHQAFRWGMTGALFFFFWSAGLR